MKHCQFYIIDSKKSEEVVNGLKKITLGCENKSDTHVFFWIDKENNIKQIQFLFGELVLEWFHGKGFKFSRTNRTLEIPKGIGFHKGVRILHPVNKNATIEIALEKAKNSEYPPDWSEKILEKF